MQVSYDLSSLKDIDGLSEVVDLKNLQNYDGITLNGKILSKSQQRELKQTIMSWANKNSNYGKIIEENIGSVLDKKEAIYINTSDMYSAPRKWNFYDRLTDDKKLELMESIEENGILSPIIIWEINYSYVECEYVKGEIDSYNLNGKRYMVLAGHNRVDAFVSLYKSTNDDKYLKIPSFIFSKDELTIESAKEIVIDTNYVQRVLSTKEMHMSIMHKYMEVDNGKQKSGRTREVVAEALGISPAKVEMYKKLDKLIPELKDMVYDETLALTSVLKVVDKSSELQKWIYDTYKDVATNKLLNKIKPYMKKSHIQDLFDKELNKAIPNKKVTIEVPDELIEEFKEMAYQWIYNKTKRD